jgi:co-chaperonin GroES (HSP10)
MYAPIKINELEALGDHVLVKDMNFDGRKLSSGIVLLGDDSRSSGIRPRWAEVYAVGPTQTDIKVGEWICVEHGRWTRGVTIEDSTGEHVLRRVDPSNIMMASDSEPPDDTFSSAVQIDRKDRW